MNQPTVLHVITKKGKGYPLAEADKIGQWHGVKPFNVETGEPLVKKAENEHSWSNIINEYLTRKANELPLLRVIIPAMISGSELLGFQKAHPDKIIDVGICEAFAVCFSGAMALESIPVFVPIYSSFLQRAYDQMNHDICRQNAPVVFGIDRSGIVGDDGETHQGIYDIAYLRHLPNMTITQPKDPLEAYSLLNLAFKEAKGPFALRYSNHPVNFTYQDTYSLPEITWGSWEQCRFDGDINVIAYGDNLKRIEALMAENELKANLYNARFIKPFDEVALKKIVDSNLKTFVIEDSIISGGLGSSLLEWMSKNHVSSDQFELLGLPDEFIQQGKWHQLYEHYHLDNSSLLARFQKAIAQR